MNSIEKCAIVSNAIDQLQKIKNGLGKVVEKGGLPVDAVARISAAMDNLVYADVDLIRVLSSLRAMDADVTVRGGIVCGPHAPVEIGDELQPRLAWAEGEDY